MSFILRAQPQGVVYGYRANDNVSFIQKLCIASQSKRMCHEYVYESGRRTRVQAYFAIGHIDAVIEIEKKMADQTCMSAKRITDLIGKTNVTVLVFSENWLLTISKNQIMSQPIPSEGLIMSFGKVESSFDPQGNMDLDAMGYIQQVIQFVPIPPPAS